MIEKYILSNSRFKNTEFYYTKLKNTTRFVDIPYSYKKELIESQSLYPPYGNFTDLSKKIYQVYRTSGTTANPLLLSFTKKDIQRIS